MEKLLLSEIAECLGTECPCEKTITEISTDTRNLPEGCLFIAIKGERFDGHTFIRKAIENGAAAAVSEYPVDGCPCIVTDNTRKALLKIAAYYRRKFSPILVGVTGSVGKTTTKEMIALVLSEKYKTLKTQGNFNNEIGLPKTLFNLNSSHEAAVIEMGMSNFGEIERLSETAAPTMGVITNIGFSHIENLKSQDGILKAKLEILKGMEDNAPLIVNGDDARLAPLKNNLDAHQVYLYGTDNECNDFKAVNIKEENGITIFDIKYPDGEITAEIPCVGRHNVLNAAAAFAVGILNGLSDTEIVSALKKYKPDGMRQNIVKKGDVTVIIDCYNASPDSMRASLNVLAGMECTGRKIAVLGDMLELGDSSEKLHRMAGNMAVHASPDMLFCFGKDSGYIGEEAKKSGINAYHTCDKNMLTEKIKEFIKPGDTILFKASRGMKLEEVIDKLFG
ncbi:UDP-N-acetylmuramoyl-tripeptide--D-alanyl-D-alanine ligase [Porcipelethomonas sp.]|uniref:UDP-N-acetylmuramoyl-tripeptide--D-alanyl-D- alanine ligase n=1 Tax=Porcipelethomonas sp. TaxID=2981675 RepID=UPI003EF2AF11